MAAEPLGHRPALDGLRGLCILGVMASHYLWSMPWARPAQLGVDVFFVLSGFLITALLLEESAGSGIKLRRFYLRRAARLLPALFLMLGVVVPVGLVLWPNEVTQLEISALAAMFYVINWVMVFSHRTFWIIPHTWSLAVEEQFYLVWPPLLALALKRVPNRRILTVRIGALCAAFALWRVHLLFSHASGNRMLFGFDARADELLAGCLAAAVRHWDLLPVWVRKPSAAQGAGAAVAALSIAVFIWGEHDQMETWGRPVFALSVAFFILSILEAEHFPGRLLCLSPLTWLGQISYGVYLWHVPVFLVSTTLIPRLPWVTVPGAVLISLAIAWVSYRSIERPALLWVRRIRASGSGPHVANDERVG